MLRALTEWPLGQDNVPFVRMQRERSVSEQRFQRVWQNTGSRDVVWRRRGAGRLKCIRAKERRAVPVFEGGRRDDGTASTRSDDAVDGQELGNG